MSDFIFNVCVNTMLIIMTLFVMIIFVIFCMGIYDCAINNNCGSECTCEVME